MPLLKARTILSPTAVFVERDKIFDGGVEVLTAPAGFGGMEIVVNVFLLPDAGFFDAAAICPVVPWPNMATTNRHAFKMPFLLLIFMVLLLEGNEKLLCQSLSVRCAGGSSNSRGNVIDSCPS